MFESCYGASKPCKTDPLLSKTGAYCLDLDGWKRTASSLVFRGISQSLAGRGQFTRCWPWTFKGQSDLGGVAPVEPALGAYTPCWLAGEGLVWWYMQGNSREGCAKEVSGISGIRVGVATAVCVGSSEIPSNLAGELVCSWLLSLALAPSHPRAR